MGYKSVLRSVNASVNKSARASEQRQRQQQRAAQKVYNQSVKELERQQKKLARLEEKLNKVYEALDQKYATGKIDAAKFEELKSRKSDIGIELVVLGEAAGVALGKRYMTGEIDKKEFDTIYLATMPTGYITERDSLKSKLDSIVTNAKQFKTECDKTTGCQHCGMKPSLFKRVKNFEGCQLCVPCTKAIQSILYSPEFNGIYFSGPAYNYTLENVLQDKPVFTAVLKSDWI